ncbi:MAG: multiubiquitin domain-containing protein [Bacteroidales bacterium]|jgi:hypothetical protein|nr:multiubiquitin domain-containing protein [Bacteroidales bacterium]
MVTKENKNDAPGQNKEFTIYVNGTPETWHSKEISFSEVVSLAFEKPPYGVNTEYQVVFSEALGPLKEGTLAEGQTVHIKKEGTQFDVSATDKS